MSTAATAEVSSKPVIRQTHAEEWANVLTHGIGLLLAIGAALTGLIVAAAYGGVLRFATILTYGLALVLVYLTSTGFHLAGVHRWRDGTRNAWRLLDHCAIYLLIAATYTPVMLLAVGGAWGWCIFAIIWLLAAAGITFKSLMVGRYDSFDRMDTALYLAMGWLCVVAIVPIWMSLSSTGFLWLVLGGAFYSVGCVFFLWERLRFNHAIWHGFVLVGSACHFAMILMCLRA
jgi:hemolysin III